jgi:signal transduction histidine kinase
MDNQESEHMPAVPRERLVAQRMRIGALLLAVVIALNGVLDWTTRPGGLWPVAWIYVGDFLLVALVVAVMRRERSERQTVAIAAGAVMLWNALFCIYAVLSPGEIHALFAPSIVITAASALLVPWGVIAQTAVSTVCVATYACAFVLSGRDADLGTLYVFIALLSAAAATSVGAYLVEQHGRVIDEQTESLREMNRLMREAGVKKDEFLASVSHELRTPLNVVLGYIDLLLDHSFGPLEPAQRDILHRITRNASDLSHLINDLIDLSRIEAGRLKVDVSEVELTPMFAELRGVMDVLLAGHNIEFHAAIGAECGAVAADPDRLKQILSNLLVNAVKFTEQGSITLAAARTADGAVALSVTDTGIGIPPAAHQAIFEPFRQVHDRSRRVPGAGIGLSLSSRLAQLMGGSLHVASEPGRGSCFTLSVPAAQVDTQTVPLLRKVS